MTESLTISREDLEALIDRRVAQQSRRGTASSDDPLLQEAAGAPPRSKPDSPESEMEQVAKQRGGLWSADRKDWRQYGGMVHGRDGKLKKVDACPHADPHRCDQCWTPETEARWAYSLGLSDEPGIPLDRPEDPRSQRANVPTSGAERARLGGRRPANMPG